MYILLHNRQKRYTKIFPLVVFSIAFSVVPSLEVIQKMRSNTKRGEGRGGETKVLLDGDFLRSLYETQEYQ